MTSLFLFFHFPRDAHIIIRTCDARKRALVTARSNQKPRVRLFCSRHLVRSISIRNRAAIVSARNRYLTRSVIISHTHTSPIHTFLPRGRRGLTTASRRRERSRCCLETVSYGTEVFFSLISYVFFSFLRVCSHAGAIIVQSFHWNCIVFARRKFIFVRRKEKINKFANRAHTIYVYNIF